MANASLQKLADMTGLLMQRTMSGTISWELTSTEGTYATRLGSVTAHISEEPGQGVQPDYLIRLYNSNGEIVDSFTDVDLAGYSTNFSEEGFFSIMSELYVLAGRQASGADQLIDEVLKFLK